eukprot:GDKJ01019072.1.p1 GENE.GDKJ01019072.1~~GDKJ01019072.1.p1  ORF type:complete len:291 (+),score=62.12 GDKJ01019072.1:127-873(+)
MNPDWVDWSIHYPQFFGKPETENLYLNTSEHPIFYTKKQPDHLNGAASRHPDWLDIGCGFGGLSVTLGEKFPQKLILALEIREKVSTYVGKRILAARFEKKPESAEHSKLANVTCFRQNVMKNIVNYCRKASVERMFFCFPDPHFKKSNWRRRIINPGLLSIYAYCMKVGGLIYCVTDVEDLHNWMYSCLKEHPSFEEVPLDSLNEDDTEVLQATKYSTEESKKVEMMKGSKWACVFRRLADPEEEGW